MNVYFLFDEQMHEPLYMCFPDLKEPSCYAVVPVARSNTVRI